MAFRTRLEYRPGSPQELLVEFEGAVVRVGARQLAGGDVELIVSAPPEVRLTPPAIAEYGKPAGRDRR